GVAGKHDPPDFLIWTARDRKNRSRGPARTPLLKRGAERDQRRIPAAAEIRAPGTAATRAARPPWEGLRSFPDTRSTAPIGTVRHAGWRARPGPIAAHRRRSSSAEWRNRVPRRPPT